MYMYLHMHNFSWQLFIATMDIIQVHCKSHQYNEGKSRSLVAVHISVQVIYGSKKSYVRKSNWFSVKSNMYWQPLVPLHPDKKNHCGAHETWLCIDRRNSHISTNNFLTHGVHAHTIFIIPLYRSSACIIQSVHKAVYSMLSVDGVLDYNVPHSYLMKRKMA